MPTLRSPLRLATLAAASCAMLSACAASPARRGPEPGAALPPIVKTDRIVETVCPAELGQDPPAKVHLPAGAELSGNAEGLGYAAARFRREEMLEGRLADARAACPKPAP